MFALYDPLKNGYLNRNQKIVASWKDAKQYKLLKWAVSPSTGAGLLNVSRNIPPGYTPSNKYQNLPNIEVHEYDSLGHLIAVHHAPPAYITIP